MADYRNLQYFKIIALLLCMLSYTNIKLTESFNVDTKVPIIKSGPRDSFFGFSVAQHRIHDYQNPGVSIPVVLVGAPKANVTDSGAPPEVKSLPSPGGVYKCHFSSFSQDCEPLKLFYDGGGNPENLHDQWMGVSVASQGTDEGLAVACAHRYKKVGPSFNWGPGLCISLTNSLDEDLFYEPCNAKPTDKGHEEYGFCQAGISTDVDEEGDLLLGSPGPRTWRGAVFLNSLIQSLETERRWYQSVVDDPRKQHPEDPEPAIRGFYSYLGMSVKIGRLIEGRKTFVAGAPRADDVGQVLLFTKEDEEITIKQEHYLTGEQFGSSFGYDLAIGDFNIDGKEDLVVGAPFYHGTGVGGAIYVYMNGPQGITFLTKPTKITSRKMRDAECAQLNCQNARFGFALASIGDVNRDGFDDLAVGAPYEGNGAVYIFHGSPQGLKTEYAQRIVPADFPRTAIQPIAFGTSITGGMDMDENGYPDLVIGSFTSGTIHVLRARPVIKLQSEFNAEPNIISPKQVQCPKNGHPQACFEVKVCVRFTAEPKEKFSESVSLIYTLEAEKFTGTKISRVQFDKALQSADHSTVGGVLNLRSQFDNRYDCITELAYIAGGTKDFLNPISLRVDFKLKDDKDPIMNEGDTPPDLNFYPVLDTLDAKSTTTVDFEKDCGDDSKCESDLQLVWGISLDKDGDGDYIAKVGQDKEILLEVSVLNNGEDAHEATLRVTLPDALGYQGTDDRGKDHSCGPRDGFVECAIGNPLGGRQKISFGIRLDTTGAAPSRKVYDIAISVNTTSIELNPDNNVDSLRIKILVVADLYIKGISNPEQTYFEGEVVGESAIRYANEIGVQISHIYAIRNNDRAVVSRSTVEIQWPHEVPSRVSSSRGKHLLYLWDITVTGGVDGAGKCEVVGSRVNRLRILPSEQKDNNDTAIASTYDEDDRKGRGKREAGERTGELKIGGGGGGTEVLDCEKGTARCQLIRCRLGPIDRNNPIAITIISRLWNPTFVEYYTGVQEVQIYSRAQLIIDPDLDIQQDTTNDKHWAVTKANPTKGVQEAPGIPIWVIIVGVLVGVIILVALILILWKCGFFKRERYSAAPHSAKVEKHNDYDEYHD